MPLNPKKERKKQTTKQTHYDGTVDHFSPYTTE